MRDVMDEVAGISDLLYSAGNRIETAKILLQVNREDLLATTLEDFFYGAQLIMEHCIKEE